MTGNRFNNVFFAGLAFLSAMSCEDERDFSINPSIGFSATEGSVLESNATGMRVGLYANVKITEPVTVTISINNFQGLEYGVDFTTEPAPVNNLITLAIGADETLPAFFVFPIAREEVLEPRKINFQIVSVSGSGIQPAQPAALSYTLSIAKVQPLHVFHDFNGCSDFATPEGFIEAFEPGSKTDRGWGCRAFGLNSTRAVRCSAFGGAAGEDRAWLIMNPVSIPGGSAVTLHFWSFSNFTGPGKLNVRWSNNYSGSGNPLLATWTDLPTINAQLPAPNSQTWVEVTGTFNNISGNTVYLAFVYTEGTSASSTSWDIDDLTFTVQ